MCMSTCVYVCVLCVVVCCVCITEIETNQCMRSFRTSICCAFWHERRFWDLMCVCVCVCVYVCVCVCLYIYVCVCSCVSSKAKLPRLFARSRLCYTPNTHIHTYPHIYIYVHTLQMTAKLCESIRQRRPLSQADSDSIIAHLSRFDN